MSHFLVTRLRPEFGERGGFTEEHLNTLHLCRNSHPHAFEILKPKLERYIATNPNYMGYHSDDNNTYYEYEVGEFNPNVEFDDEFVDDDDEAEAEYDKFYFDYLAVNPCPELVAWMLEDPKHRLAIDNAGLNPHPDMIAFLEKKPDFIYGRDLSFNKSSAAIALLRKFPEEICWWSLSKNPHPDAVALLLENRDNIDWTEFSQNPHPDAVALLLENRDKIHWQNFSGNSHPDAVALLLAHPEKIDKRAISRNNNGAAVEWLKENLVWGEGIDTLDNLLERLDFMEVCNNTNPDALALLSRIPDSHRIDWISVGYNCTLAALDIFWKLGYKKREGRPRGNIGASVSGNPYIFEEVYDYAAIRARMDFIREDLAKAAFHPRRLAAHLASGGDPDDF